MTRTAEVLSLMLTLFEADWAASAKRCRMRASTPRGTGASSATGAGCEAAAGAGSLWSDGWECAAKEISAGCA
jgi:hypothetical protein